MVVMKFSLPVILLDELFKWIARNYVNDMETDKLSELVAILATNCKQFTPFVVILTVGVNSGNPFEQVVQ